MIALSIGCLFDLKAFMRLLYLLCVKHIAAFSP